MSGIKNVVVIGAGFMGKYSFFYSIIKLILFKGVELAKPAHKTTSKLLLLILTPRP
jgi:hypothetical protein